MQAPNTIATAPSAAKCVAKVVLMGAILPLTLKTPASPGGLHIEV